MEWNIEYHKDSDYIFTLVTGAVTVEKAQKLAIELLEITKQTNTNRFLVDFSNTSVASSVAEIHKLPEALLELGISIREKFALVYEGGSPQAYLFTFFASICVFKPLNIKVFSHYDEAYQWLIAPAK